MAKARIYKIKSVCVNRKVFGVMDTVTINKACRFATDGRD